MQDRRHMYCCCLVTVLHTLRSEHLRQPLTEQAHRLQSVMAFKRSHWRTCKPCFLAAASTAFQDRKTSSRSMLVRSMPRAGMLDPATDPAPPLEPADSCWRPVILLPCCWPPPCLLLARQKIKHRCTNSMAPPDALMMASTGTSMSTHNPTVAHRACG